MACSHRLRIGLTCRRWWSRRKWLLTQAWTGDWRVVVICPHRELQFGALIPVQKFVERRVLWVELQPRDGQPPITPLILWPLRCCR